MPVVIKWNSASDIFVLDDSLNQALVWSPDMVHAKKSDLNSAWMPAADIYETEETIIIVVELAGIDRDSLEIVFQEGYLLLRGKRPFYPHIQPAKIHRIERAYGCFQRVFGIPKPVDPKQVSASYEQGMLKIALTKRSQPVAETVNIPVNFE